MRAFEFYGAGRVIFGGGCLGRLGELAGRLGARRVLLVSDPGVVAAGWVHRASEGLHRAALETVVFAGVGENPTTRHVEEGVRFAGEQGVIDFIVGLGGGSAMDCAKGINFLLTNGGRMEDYQGVDRAAKPMLPSIGVPTTAGTGSEAQSFALIEQARTHRKMACGDKKARFGAVILDPELLGSAPQGVLARAGMDALAHAVESYVSAARNPLSQMYAREAWRLLDSAFEQLLDSSADAEARGRMLLGAHWAGAAIEHSMLGAAHACANPLSARYRTAHGAAVALVLPQVVRFNGKAAEGLYAELLQASGRRGGAEAMAARLVELRQAAGLPGTLRECGVDERALSRLAGEAARQWTARHNPRPVGESELLQLYEAAY